MENEGIRRVDFLEQILDDLLLMASARAVYPIFAFFQLITFVKKQRHIASIINHELRALPFPIQNRPPRAIPVFLEGFALPREDRHAGLRDGRGGVILRRENVTTRPAHCGAEFGQRLNEHRRLNGHVKRSGDPDARKRLVRSVFFANGHQAGHFLLGDRDFLASPIGKRNVADFEVGGLGKCSSSHSRQSS